MTDGISQEQNSVQEQEAKTQEIENKESEFVSKKAYDEVTQDMHKYKKQLREIQANFNEMKASKEAQERAVLEENEQWKELYEKERVTRETLEAKRKEEQGKFIDSHKINAVVQKLGGFKKSEYNKFINAKNIELRDDGSIDEDSLANEVSRIKQEFPELIKVSNAPKLPKDAPSAQSTLGRMKSLSEMSRQEKLQLLREIDKKKK